MIVWVTASLGSVAGGVAAPGGSRFGCVAGRCLGVVAEHARDDRGGGLEDELTDGGCSGVGLVQAVLVKAPGDRRRMDGLACSPPGEQPVAARVGGRQHVRPGRGNGVRPDAAVASAISVCGPIERFRDEVEACAGHLLEVTGALSVKLGHRA